MRRQQDQLARDLDKKLKQDFMSRQKQLLTDLECLIKNKEDAAFCVICQEAFSEQSQKQKISCGHQDFHQKCINDWFKKSETCPLCVQPAKIVKKPKK